MYQTRSLHTVHMLGSVITEEQFVQKQDEDVFSCFKLIDTYSIYPVYMFGLPPEPYKRTFRTRNRLFSLQSHFPVFWNGLHQILI